MEVILNWVDSWVAADRRRQEYTVDEWKSYLKGLSKKLAYILPHGAAENGLTMRSDASIELRDLLEHNMFRRFSKDEVQFCVEHDAKKRFLLFEEGGKQFIRAHQGHT